MTQNEEVLRDHINTLKSANAKLWRDLKDAHKHEAGYRLMRDYLASIGISPKWLERREEEYYRSLFLRLDCDIKAVPVAGRPLAITTVRRRQAQMKLIAG